MLLKDTFHGHGCSLWMWIETHKTKWGGWSKRRIENIVVRGFSSMVEGTKNSCQMEYTKKYC